MDPVDIQYTCMGLSNNDSKCSLSSIIMQLNWLVLCGYHNKNLCNRTLMTISTMFLFLFQILIWLTSELPLPNSCVNMKVNFRSDEAQRKFLKILFDASLDLTKCFRSFIEKEVTLFNITYREKLCIVFPQNVW